MLLAPAVIALASSMSGFGQVLPWGVCAHLGGHEFADRDRELSLMQKAGIRWARADFTWGYFEPQKGHWQFDRYDQLLQSAERYGVNLLPILCYNVDWAFPAHEHLDDWCEYVRTVVGRYRDRIRYWEVWNEPNIGFWKPKPDAEQYARLLVASYKAIKDVAPEAQVLFGGTSGVPLGYIKQVFDHGAFDAFDVLAVHPYRYPAAPELRGIPEDLQAVSKLVDKYGGGKPLWITEFGWPTHINPVVDDREFLRSLIRYAAALRFPDRQEIRAAVLFEEGLPGADRAFVEQLVERLKELDGWQVELVDLRTLGRLDPRTTQVLILPTGEHYPADYFDQIIQFVRDGGLLVHLGGVPFYYADRRKGNRWETPVAGEVAREALHVGWKAWWTQQGVPREASRAQVVPPANTAIKLPVGGKIKSYRWLTNTRLKPGDKFVPLLAAYNGKTLVGYPVVVYLYDSDLKGGLLSVCLDLGRRGVSEERQALYLPRAFMVALGSGVQNVFWYEFRDGGPDPTYNEHRFGIVHLDMTPKPAYHAYAAMTRALGVGRFLGTLDVGDGTFCYVFDTGKATKTAALWRAEGLATVRLRVAGTDVKSVDHLGHPIELRRTGAVIEVSASESVTYITGITEVSAVR